MIKTIFSTRIFLAATFTLAGLTALTVVTPEAQAAFNLCNHTSYVLKAAHGEERSAQITTKGWLTLYPGHCQTIAEPPLDADNYFVTARADNAYQVEMVRFDGARELCIRGDDFILTEHTTCNGDDQRRAGFIEVTPKSREHWSTAFNENRAFTAEQAKIAGLQRLLNHLGLNAGDIDGFMGEKTKQALQEFLKTRELDLPPYPSVKIFTALAEELKKSPGASGLEICNTTPHALWAAHGTSRENEKISQGWYRLEPGQCNRISDISLTQSPQFLFAEATGAGGPIVTGPGNKPLQWTGPEIFCTKNIKFKISDHSNCIRRGIDEHGFMALDTKGQPYLRFDFEMPVTEGAKR